MKALIKKLADLVAIALLTTVLIFLAEDMVEEVKSHEEPDYADVKGCTAEDYDFSNCT